MNTCHRTIPAIDLFAGPGGLSEGFADAGFEVVLSIEKDAAAHRTLELRSFFRQFPAGKVPEDYYRYLRGEISRETLFLRYPGEARRARTIAWCAELGVESDHSVDVRIKRALRGAEHWVLLGGPPCKAYSIAGRSRRAHDPTFHSDELHTLYVHYLRILAVHTPSVFVFENVKGLLSSQLESEPTFDKILTDLQNPTGTLAAQNGHMRHLRKARYNVRSFTASLDPAQPLRATDSVIRAEQYGVPQARHRVILLGIRSDLAVEPEPLKIRTEVRTACVLRDLPRIRSMLSQEPDGHKKWHAALSDILGARLTDTAGREVRRAIQKALKKASRSRQTGARFMISSGILQGVPQDLEDWLLDSRIGGVCNHESRSHRRDDLHRYMFAACFAQVRSRSPLLDDFPRPLLPNHKNVSKAINNSHHFSDRFRVQLPSRPSTTITSHIAKDGHYFIHYDPAQCRSLTVREAARLQTFPDNYFFEGNRTEQYTQVGNAVPPFLALQLAVVVRKLLKEALRTGNRRYLRDKTEELDV